MSTHQLHTLLLPHKGGERLCAQIGQVWASVCAELVQTKGRGTPISFLPRSLKKAVLS